ncbi:hypothetical protein ACFL01_04465 [Planctomycetota bacterium]
MTRRWVVLILLMGTAVCGCVSTPVKKGETVFYPSLPQRPRLQFLHSITDEGDLGKTGNSFKEFLTGESPRKKKFARPYDVAASKGKIYVLDRVYKKLLVVDLINKRFDHVKDERLGALQNPSGIWVTADDVKYVADMKRKQVVVYGPDNKYLRAYGSKDTFERPVDVVVHGSNVCVADMKKNRIFILNRESGKVERTIGKLGSDEGYLYKPTHLAADGAGNIFVTDSFNFRAQKFDPNGKLLGTFGKVGDSVGSFARPKGLAIDREGRLYVSDAAFENVQIFDEKTGRLLLFFGGPGSAPGCMYLPSGVHIDYDNVEYFDTYKDKDFDVKYLVYVVNMYGNRKLSVYGFGNWIGEPLPEPERGSPEEESGKSNKE